MNKNDNKKRVKICLISSSGGHYEQLRMLKSLSRNFESTWITEKTKYPSDADFYLIQTGSKDKLYIIKMFINFVISLFLWVRLRPDYVITTGTMIVIPMVLIAKLFHKKVIYIETFARVKDGTKTGKFIYKYADLFIVQWIELLKVYPNAVYGGSIY